MGSFSTIKPKTGTCQDCGHEKYLTAGRCRSCYWQHRAKVNSNKPAAKTKQEQKDDLTPWFKMQLTMAPALCENTECRAPLRESMVINPRSIVAHILPKAGFKEVATHPLNRMFLCETCHSRYDGHRIEKIPVVVSLARHRLSSFINEVLPGNTHKIPNYLL